MNRVQLTNLIKQGYEEAQEITQQFAKTFYFASQFLPKKKRLASYSIYAICRISDEAVDNPVISKENELDITKQRIALAYSSEEINDNILLAFRDTINTFHIPRHYFDTLLEGMAMDIYKNRYENFNELYSYCYKVAGVVGLIMIHLFGYKDKKAEKYAVELGVAMQLTNILRDIKEDYKRQRIYLPEEEMEKFTVTESMIANETLNQNFINLLKSQIKQTRQYYNNSSIGIKLINSISARFVVCLMKNMYAGIVCAIENNEYDIFSKRASVSFLGKIWLLLKTLFRGEYL